MALREFELKPPADVYRVALRYIQAWNKSASLAIKEKDPTKAQRAIETADHILGQLGAVQFRSGLTSAQLTLITELANRFGDTVRNRRPSLEKILADSPDHNPMLRSKLENELAPKTLLGVMNELETTGALGKTEELVFQKITAAKAKDLIETSSGGSWTQVEKDAFFKLMTAGVEPLIEYGVFKGVSINTIHLTVTDPDKLLDSLDSSSGGSTAIQFNAELNDNMLVKSSTVDKEQYSDDMGVIQAICCGMYHLMKTKGSPGDGRFTTFDRAGDSYRADKSIALIDFVCSQTALVVVDAGGFSHTLNIAAMLARFPSDVQTIIKYIAKLKASRDDLGQRASNYIQFKDGKSAKLLGTGANAKDYSSGYISRMMYKTAQTADNTEFMIALGYVDIRGVPGGPSFDPLTRIPTAGDARARALYDKMCLMDGVHDYFRPESSPLARAVLSAEPLKWDQDFPSLDEFTNRVDRQRAEAYRGARNVWRQIATSAYESTAVRIPSDPTSMKLAIEGFLSPMFTNAATLMSYLGPGTTHAPPGGSPPPAEFSKYVPFHEIPKAALKFILKNLILSVPGRYVKEDQQKWFKFSSFGSVDINKEVRDRRTMAVNIIKTEILQYPSLGHPAQIDSYANELLSFLDSPWLIEEKALSDSERNVIWNVTRINHTPSLSAIDSKQTNRELDRVFTFPFSASKDKKE